MELFGISVIEHPGIPNDEAWVVYKKEAAQVPQDLRDKLHFPCILTGNMALTKGTLTLWQAINYGAPPPKSTARVGGRR